jgi:hypothetical protein
VKLLASLVNGVALIVTSNAWVEPSKTGQEIEIRKSYETVESSDDSSSSGSSNGHDTIVERVMAVRDDGVELVYDLPISTAKEDRRRDWQLPARVFRSNDGSLKLLNADELNGRLEKWLEAAKWDRSVCGKWIFTWNAFFIDCDPQSVLKTISAFDLNSAGLSEGDLYSEPGTLAAGILTLGKSSANSKTLLTEMKIDPDYVRRSSAESDVVVGEIMQKPVTLEDAIKARSSEKISGTVAITLELDGSAHIKRKIKVTKVAIERPGEPTLHRTNSETLERIN